MLTRNIGKLIRGKVTPFQIVSACVLGSMLGFIPAFSVGIGLTVALVLLLVLLNANLFLATMMGFAAKLLSLLMLPVSFMVGRALLDGPTRPIFKSAINAPVLALFGFEHYATTGGVLLGLLLGLGVGIALTSVVMMLRRRLALLEAGSEKFNKLLGSWWFKVPAFVFIGGKSGNYEALLKKKVGLPVRPLGIVLVLLVGVLLYVGRMFLADEMVLSALHKGLESANGATVDIKDAKLDLGAGKLTVTGLAMADPGALDKDIFRASEVVAAVRGKDLLRKRLAIDLLTVRDGQSGGKRDIPGHLVGARAATVPPSAGEGKTIEDYIKDAQRWKDRLAQGRRWLDKVRGPQQEGTESGQPGQTGQPGQPGAPGVPGAPSVPPETLRQRLEREAKEKGYAKVVASHLIDQAPTLLIAEVSARGVKTAQLPDEVLDITGKNISTQPWLVEGGPSVSVASKSGKIGAGAALAGKTAPGAVPEPGHLMFKYQGLSTDAVAAELIGTGGEKPIKGGTMDVSFDGTLVRKSDWYIDAPLQVVLHDTTISLPGFGAEKVANFAMPIGLAGPLENPRVKVDGKKLADALAAAGAKELAAKARGEAEKAINKETEKATTDLEKKIGDKVPNPLDLLGGKKKK
jgi:uncharacterized protein (TIGR03546 family)